MALREAEPRARCLMLPAGPRRTTSVHVTGRASEAVLSVVRKLRDGGDLACLLSPPQTRPGGCRGLGLPRAEPGTSFLVHVLQGGSGPSGPRGQCRGGSRSASCGRGVSHPAVCDGGSSQHVHVQCQNRACPREPDRWSPSLSPIPWELWGISCIQQL